MSEVVALNADGSVWVPAFEGQRAPFQRGNLAAAQHGAYSPRTVEPRARAYVDEVASDPATAYLTQPRFATALHSWAQSCARVDLVQEYVDRLGVEESMQAGRGQVSPMELLAKLSAGRDRVAARLGLDPLSAARLGKDIAQGAQASAAGVLTALRAEHEAAAGGGV